MYRQNRNFEIPLSLITKSNENFIPVNGTSGLPTEKNDMKPTLEEKYRDGQDSFKMIFEKSPFGSLVLTKTLAILYVNSALINLLGYKVKDDLISLSIADFAWKDFKDDWCVLQDSLWSEQKQSINFETCLQHRNGTKVWCEVTSILYQDDGYGLGYTIIEDISKRKQDEEVIKKSEANLRNILDNADAGYVLYNDERRIVSFNTLAEKFSLELYGKALCEGGFMLDYFPEERHQILMDITTQVINGSEVSYELLISNEYGEKWMEVKWLNVQNSENKHWGFILASKDITDKKLAAAEREKMTNDIINRNKILEQFTNITSHNLRAPVANIIGLLELVEELELDEAEKKEMLDGVLVSARNLDTVINDINQILQVRDKQSEQREEIWFNDLVDSIKTSISNVITKDHVAINCNFNAVEHMFTTRTYLYSAFYNLLLNSIKYRRVGVQPEITITSDIVNDKIQLRFADNGKGIDLNRHGANLFGLYKRFDSSVEGKGLGLFMVKAQIEAIGGTIGVESEVGVGTTFTIELPI